MKRVIYMLMGVAVALSACTPNDNGPQYVEPEFPTVQFFEADTKRQYQFTFTVDQDWKISLPQESQPYALIAYGDIGTMPELYGEAGEHTITVVTKDVPKSYAKDFVVRVQLTLDNITKDLAVYTIPHIPFEINVSGAPNEGAEDYVKTTFYKGGHPQNGPFANSANPYTVRHYTAMDACYSEFAVEHDYPREKYNYVVYVKNKDGEFVSVEAGNNPNKPSTSWVTFAAFGDSEEKFRMDMDITNEKAVKTPNVGYEAYVNIEIEEDGTSGAEGGAIISVYYVFNPDDEIIIETGVELANPALAKEKGVTFEFKNEMYTLTIPTVDLLEAESCAATMLKFKGYQEVYGGMESGTKALKLIYNKEIDKDYCVAYVVLTEDGTPEALVRENPMNTTAVKIGGGQIEYTINVVFSWISADYVPPTPEEPEETPEGTPEETPEVTPEE